MKKIFFIFFIACLFLYGCNQEAKRQAEIKQKTQDSIRVAYNERIAKEENRKRNEQDSICKW